MKPNIHNLAQLNSVISGGDQPVRLAFRVCSNPKPRRVLWATPVYALRPGQQRGGIVAGNLTRTQDDITCYLVRTVEIWFQKYIGYGMIQGDPSDR